jgi:hypothetical protein
MIKPTFLATLYILRIGEKGYNFGKSYGEKSGEEAKNMQKWEYCAIAGISRSQENLGTIQPAVWNFTINGIQVTPILEDKSNAVAKCIAELGEKGWEMVGAGSTGEGYSHNLYFKRQINQ